MTADEADDLIESDQMCAVCLMPFDNYKNLDETQSKLKMVRSKIENMIEKQEFLSKSPSDTFFSQHPSSARSTDISNLYKVKS